MKPESDIDDRDSSILPACDSQSDASADSVTDRKPESESEDIDIDECRFVAARCENNTALVRDTNITETMISCQKLGSNFLLRSISKDTPDEYFLSLKDMKTLKSCLGQVIITQTTSHISRQPDFCVEDPIVILARGEYKIVIDQDHHVVVVRRIRIITTSPLLIRYRMRTCNNGWTIMDRWYYSDEDNVYIIDHADKLHRLSWYNIENQRYPKKTKVAP
jgi:hypothetical protein